MTTRINVYPASGTTVLDDGGVVIPASGLNVILNDYYLALIRAGNLLTYNTDGVVGAVDEIGAQLETYFCTELTARRGTIDDAAIWCAGYSTPLDGGEGLFYWSADSTTPADGGCVFGSGVGRWLRIYKGPVRPEWYNVKGDGSTNDYANLQTSIYAANGSTLKIETGNYALSSGLVYPPTPGSIVGSGANQTTLKFALNDSTDCITLTPSAALQNNSINISDLGILDPTNGTRTGRYGFYLDTYSTTTSIGQLKLKGVTIGGVSTDGKYAFYHRNNNTLNVNGGMYCSTISDSQLNGGIRLTQTGDSNNIQRNICSGRNIGVHASLVLGASCLAIENNNITCNGGAIRLDSGARFRIKGNNTENYSEGALAQNGGAGSVYISGDVAGVGGYYYLYGGVIKENLFSVYADSDADCCVRLANCQGTEIINNTFLSGGGGAGPSVGIRVDSTCNDVRIGANNYNSAITTQVVDLGVGTMGVVKTPTLLNGWVVHNSSHELSYIKSTDGIVHFSGTISGGTTTAAIQIFTMPVGFRPSKIVRALGYFNDGASKVVEVTVESAGEVRLAQATTSAAYVSFSFSYPASTLANSVSRE